MLIKEALEKVRELRSEVGPPHSAYGTGYREALEFVEDLLLQVMWEAGVDDDGEREELAEVGQR